MSAWPDGSSSASTARSRCRRSNICSRSITRTAAPRSAATRSGCSSAVTAWTRDLTDKLLGRGQDYLKRVSTLPPSYRRISHGDEVSIGTRRFKVITGGGHALDQVMLYCAADKLFLSADQVLSKISPNVSVWAVEPDQNSLGEYLASLASLTTTLPYDVLVLPGHGVPFYGLKTRIKQLADHHEERCGLIAEACREIPQTSKELVPVVFHKHVLDVHQMGFAAGELIAHVNYMLVEGRLTAEEADGVLRFRTT